MKLISEVFVSINLGKGHAFNLLFNLWWLNSHYMVWFLWGLKESFLRLILSFKLKNLYNARFLKNFVRFCEIHICFLELKLILHRVYHNLIVECDWMKLELIRGTRVGRSIPSANFISLLIRPIQIIQVKPINHSLAPTFPRD